MPTKYIELPLIGNGTIATLRIPLPEDSVKASYLREFYSQPENIAHMQLFISLVRPELLDEYVVHNVIVAEQFKARILELWNTKDADELARAAIQLWKELEDGMVRFLKLEYVSRYTEMNSSIMDDFRKDSSWENFVRTVEGMSERLYDVFPELKEQAS